MQPLSKASGKPAPAGTVDCAVEVLDAVPAVIWYIRRWMRAQRKGLSIPQFRALYLIRAQPAASLSAVAEHLGALLPTASRLIDGLEAKGLVTRSDCRDDRRQLELLITRQGAAVLDGAQAATLAKMRQELAALDEPQRELITRAMRLLRGVFAPALTSLGSSGAKPAGGAPPAGNRRAKYI